ncbi:cyclin-dependent protein kinase inhibitor SMR1-like [Actinidia eriantha]|uniref:cyclin-dependent protein kinase inhibitor SMR1-like n=1 Tax=Actinidia eriantha TaxID=165200 RepID=UPI00258B7084|nr:cyclin-dependent protein kinase inhibitor SMR1-like [Actinidia eriantha]
MSTDLEFPTQFQIPTIRIKPNSQSSDNATTILAPDSSDECHTPTSLEHKIPAILICPPAPKKPRNRVISSKRKLEFFEIVAREEVDSFFRSNYGLVDAKRRCPCT